MLSDNRMSADVAVSGLSYFAIGVSVTLMKEHNLKMSYQTLICCAVFLYIFKVYAF